MNPDLKNFVDFVRACKKEGVMSAELNGMKFVLSPMALEPTQTFAPSQEPEEPIEPTAAQHPDFTARAFLATEGRV